MHAESKLRVRSWNEYQHYANRKPRWVKFYVETLESYDLMRLQDASKWLACGCILLAARHDNHIPADPEWLRAELHMQEDPDLEALISVGFLEVCDCPSCASNSLATCEPPASPKRKSKRERKKEEGTPTGAPSSSRGHRELPEIPEALSKAIPDAADLLQRWLDVLPTAKIPTMRGREHTLHRLVGYLETHGTAKVRKLISTATDRYWRSMEMEWLESANGNRRSSPSNEVFAEHERFEQERRKSRPALDIPARLRELASQLPASPVGDSLRAQIEALAGGDLETVQAALERLEAETLDSVALDAEQQERVDAAQEMVRQHYQNRISAKSLGENLKIMRRQVVRKALALPALSLFA